MSEQVIEPAAATAPTTFAEAQEVLAANLPGYTRRTHQEALAAEFEAILAASETGDVNHLSHGLCQAGTGCIQGDAEIIVNRGGNARRIKLRDLVRRHTGEDLRYQWNPETPTYVQREVNGVIRLARLANAWCSGVKTTYTVTTSTGRTIRATDEHPFLTERGWLRLDELIPGDLVHVRGTQKDGGRKKINYHPVYGMHAHPFASRRTEHGSASVDEHRLTAEAVLNGFSLHEYVEMVRLGKTEGLKFIDPSVSEVHHLDHDPLNNDPSNLLVLNVEEHKMYHAEVYGKNNVLFKVTVEEIASVEAFGEEETYDIEVEGEPHNFLANGFVVHNTGKSLAALITHILSGERTIIATATKALQSQYATKDLPFLEQYLGVPFTWAVIKGRSNYPCLLQMEQVTSPTAGQAGVIARVQELSTPEAVRDLLVTDREDFPSLPDEEWRPFSISSDECPGKKACPFGETCLAERAKAKAQDAQVVVTNTAYLLQDLVLRARSDDNVQLLGEIGRVVVDEAHTLPEVARGALEDMIGQGAVVKLARDMGAYMQREDLKHALALDIEAAADSLWNHLTALYRTWVKEKNLGKNDPMALPQELIDEELGPYLAALFVAIEMARDQINSKRPFEERAKTAKTRLLRRSTGMLTRIRNYAMPEDETVRWAEMDISTFRGERRERVKLCSSPVNVGPFLRKLLWDKIPAVLMSATLATGKSFSFMEETVGLKKGEARAFDAGSPFDYPRQAVLFTPENGKPEPVQKTVTAWRAYAQGATKYLVTKSGGGALLLFTSRNAMNEAYEAIGGDFRDLGLTVLRQGDSTPGELVRIMKADGHAVLFALRTFFEGVDIQGTALRLVVLDKLPFTPPTDLVHKAREEAMVRRYRSERAGFDHLAIPEMTLVLTQAFGRLIRSVEDQGVVAILDPRLNSKAYGRRIMEALPPAARTTDPRVAAEFLRQSR